MIIVLDDDFNSLNLGQHMGKKTSKSMSPEGGPVNPDSFRDLKKNLQSMPLEFKKK